MMRGRRLTCETCALAGNEVFFYNLAKYHEHLRSHANRLIPIRCDCGVDVVNRQEDIDAHRAEEFHRNWEAEQQRAARRRQQRAGHNGLDERRCPHCGQSFEGRGEHTFMSHIGACADVDHHDAHNGGDELLLAQRDVHHQPALQNSFGPRPEWENRLFLPEVTTPIQNVCDSILLNSLAAGGKQLPHSTLDLLYRILNNPKFKEEYQRGGFSNTYSQARKTTLDSFHNKWKECTFGNSTFFVRDLSEVMAEQLADPALVESFDFIGETFTLNGIEFGVTRAAFPTSHAIQERARQKFGGDVHVIEQMLWFDQGRAEGGEPITMVCLVPLVGASTLARRRDCISPFAFFSSSASILDVIAYFVPQFQALKDNPRAPFHVGTRDRYTLEIGIIAADHPALAELIGTMIGVKAYLPCSKCYLRAPYQADDNNRIAGANDPDNWRRAEPRTQRDSIERMERRRDPTYRQQQSGIRDEFVDRECGIYALFDAEDPTLQLFKMLDSDKMHDLTFGAVKSVLAVLAQLTLDGGPRFIQQFLTRAQQLHLQRPRLLDVTLWRADDSKMHCKTTLLHNLANGNFFAREYSALLFVILLIFEAVTLDAVQNALDAVSDYFHFLAALYSPFWPVNASEEWWQSLQAYGLRSFQQVQPLLGNALGKTKRCIKIHDLMTHALDTRRRHGAGIGTEGMEGLFAFFKRLTSNCRNVGPQVMERLVQEMHAQQMVLNESEEAQVVQSIVETSDGNQWKAGSVEVPANVRQLVGNIPGEFVKWVALNTENVAGSVRGTRKVYAAPSWNHQPQFDIVMHNDVVYRLTALFQPANSAQPLAFGVVLPFVFNRFHLPIHCVLPESQIVQYPGDIHDTIVLQVWPWLQELTAERLLAVRNVVPQYDARTHKLLAMNVFNVRGELRYPNPIRWFPHMNRDHLDDAGDVLNDSSE